MLIQGIHITGKASEIETDRSSNDSKMLQIETDRSCNDSKVLQEYKKHV